MSECVYDQKLAKAATLIKQHNSRADNKLDWKAILAKIVALGGTNDDTLQEMSWEDLEDCGIPRLIARQIAKIFRLNEKKALTKHASPLRAAAMTYEELFNNYDPTSEQNQAVYDRLVAISKNRNCVVFNEDNTVNAVASATILRSLNEGFPEISIFAIDGYPVKVHKIGTKPAVFWHENPLLPGEPLLIGTICTMTNRSWEKIEHKVRQILYLAVTSTKEVCINGAGSIHDILDMLESTDKQLDKLKSRYPEAYIEWCTSAQHQLPSLMISKSKASLAESKKPNDPFYTHRKT